VFEELRRAVEGKVYATLDDKVAAVDAHLEWFEADPERVRSLTYWPWISTACQQASTDMAASSLRFGITSKDRATRTQTSEVRSYGRKPRRARSTSCDANASSQPPSDR
jgi:hypothetical protein